MYYFVSTIYFPGYDRLLEPPFRVVWQVKGEGALIAFGEGGLAPFRALWPTDCGPCMVLDAQGRLYDITGGKCELTKHKRPANWRRKTLRSMRRRARKAILEARWAASDKRLCGGVTEPAVLPDGRVPWFWRHRRFVCIEPGRERPFRYSLRTSHGRAERPLAVYLHSAAGFGVNGVMAVREVGLLPQLLFKRCHVLAPQLRLGPGFGSEEFTRDLWEAIQRVPNVDRSRIYITGTSMGGYGAIIECRRHPERYAACATAVAALGNLRRSLDGDDFDALAQTPQWLGYCRNERPVIEPLYGALQTRGADVRRTFIKRFSHGPAGPVFWLTQPWGRWMFGKRKL